MTLFRLLLTATLLLSGCAHTLPGETVPSSTPLEAFFSDNALTDQVLALDAEHLSVEDVSLLSQARAPRIFAFNGSALNTMEPFSRFLIAMGYPENAVRDPKNRAFARSGYLSSEKVANQVRAAIETEGLRPMMIGHSRGGALVVKTLHDLKDLRIGFACAIATGKWLRYVLGQWDTAGLLRHIPDSVDEFAGYHLKGDWIGGDKPFASESADYEAEGSTRVHNVRLEGAGHIGVTDVLSFAGDPASRAVLDGYMPDQAPPADAKLFFAADIWYHVKKHWCLELQRAIREHRGSPVHAA